MLWDEEYKRYCSLVQDELLFLLVNTSHTLYGENKQDGGKRICTQIIIKIT